jgi:hypothetical protein
MSTSLSPERLRLQIRQGNHTSMTSGLCQGFLQCNLVALPNAWASGFTQFCLASPKSCPLIATSKPEEFSLLALGQDIDIRTDISSYRVFKYGVMTHELSEITSLWRDHLVVFCLAAHFHLRKHLLRKILMCAILAKAVISPCTESILIANLLVPLAARWWSACDLLIKPTPLERRILVRVFHAYMVHLFTMAALNSSALRTSITQTTAKQSPSIAMKNLCFAPAV